MTIRKSLLRACFSAALALSAAAPVLMLPGQLAWAQTAETPAATLQTLPNIADLADRLLPSVVEISIESKVAGSPAAMPDLPEDSPFKDFFDDFFKKRQGEGGSGGRTVNAMGSGFVVDASGLIVTNNHVIDGAESIEVHFQDGVTLKGELVGRDPKTDLAVVRVKPEKPLIPVKFGDSDSIRIGEWVIAIGNPFGLGGSVSLGIVSARNREINAGPYDDFIQTDAAINKGNSGGPLFNLNGDVMGINTAIFSPTGGSVGIGFSVPSNTAKNVVDQLVKFGETRRGWLGVRLQAITPEIAESMSLGQTKGALIADVTADGPSAKAGIEAGDVVVEFNGKAIRELKELPRAVAETEIGKKVKVKLLRDGKEIEVEVEIGRLEDGEKKMAAASQTGEAPATISVLGMTATTVTTELRDKYKIDEKISGAVITEVAKDGPAADKRLEVGDVVLEAGGKAVSGAADITAAIAAAEKENKSSVLFLIAKGGKEGETRFIALKIKK